MYNEKLKHQFMKEQMEATPWKMNLCELIFNSTQEYEEEWDADLCTKSAEELQPMLSQITGFRARSKWSRLIILKDYVKWCIEMGVDGACPGMLEVQTVGLDKVKQQTVANPKHLQGYLDAICEPADKKATDNIYRCYYWLAYAGMAEEDILNVKCSDVDFAKLRVNYESRYTVVPIYPESLDAFHNCAELNQFLFVHPNYSKEIWKARAEGDTLIRGIKSVPTLKALRVELSRRSKQNSDKTPLKLSYFRVWISGVFYRMYEQEIIGVPPDFNAIAYQQMEGKTYKLDSGRNTMEAKRRQLVRDYEEDYERWKLAWFL